jgi:hypothetical protein
VLEQIIDVGRQRDGFRAPILTEPEKRADPQPAESGPIGAFGTIQAPLEIALRSGGMHLLVDGPVVRLLINDEPLRPGRHHGAIFGRLHRADLQ